MSILQIIFVLIFSAAYAELGLDAGKKVDERIVGGSPAAVGQYPYVVTIKLNNVHNCGGSIISPNWILTAAHCIYRYQVSQLIVVVGTNYVNQGGIVHRVLQLIWHESYKHPTRYANDIGVVQLATPISYSNVVRPIALSSSSPPIGVNCEVAGWGALNHPNPTNPNDLQHIFLETIPPGQCQEMHTQDPIHPSNICTHAPIGRGVCSGDSGGPLVCNGIQHGIVSWVVPCGGRFPDVFESVSYFRNWISSKTGV